MSVAAENPTLDRDDLAKMTELIMCHGYTFGQAFNVSEKQRHSIYAWGYELQKRHQFEKATRVFEYLCSLNHYDERGWIALGFCREKCRRYEPAIRAYMMAGTLAPKNPIPPLRTAECLMLMGSLDAAEQAIRRVLSLCGDNPEFVRRRERAAQLLKAIQKRKNKGRKP